MRLILPLLLILLCAGRLPAMDTEVDVELFLAADVSRSMSYAELELQRRGYAEALTSPEVLAAIGDGLLGRIAVTYVEWAGSEAHRVVVPWRLLENAEDAEEIAFAILGKEAASMRRTSISGVIDYAANTFLDNNFIGLRRIIDVSGDGPNNQGAPVVEARDRALARGFIINGLPLMTYESLSAYWGIPDLDVYYTRCVIGGPGSFMIPVKSWEEFVPALKKKLLLEISEAAPLVHTVQYQRPAPYDCLIGEKIRERNRSYFDSP